jgi:hypothetical protein
MNDKTRFLKIGPTIILTKEEDVTILAWTLIMQKCGLCITP